MRTAFLCELGDNILEISTIDVWQQVEFIC